MDLFLAISQGIGTSLAAGVRAFFVALLVGALASADIGVDFDGTEYDFLESAAWLGLMLALIALAWWIERAEIPVPPAAAAVAGAAIGGALFAGSLAERDYTSDPGLFAGVVVALIGYGAAHVFLRGAAERLSVRGEPGASGALEAMIDGALLVFVTLALLLEPVAYLGLGFCVWVLVVRRRRAGEKYEGLRILR